MTHPFARVATAAFGALILSTLSVAAAVAPGQSVEPAATVYASVQPNAASHG